MTQYLLQKGTNRIYVTTEGLLKRKANDMMLVDPDIVKTRIAATKRQLDEAKAILAMKRGEGVPTDIEEGAKALKALQDELADINSQISEADKGNISPDKREPETNEELDAIAFKDIVENDRDIHTIKGMRKVKSVIDYLEANYGITPETVDLDAVKAQAIAKRTETLKEQFDNKK
jgi:hypothetical protein